jgi:CHASE2 domain-containing sensor protein/signal transduction histidine kinase
VRRFAKPSTWYRLGISLFAREWLLLVVFSICFSAWLSFKEILHTPDHFVYDLIMRQSGRPADDRIIIIAIDDKSLKALGRWPWDRTTHARLLDRLSGTGGTVVAPPKAVFLDLLLSEAEAKSDPTLIQAMKHLPKVVLPLAPESYAEGGRAAQMMLPAPGYREVAALGYSFLQADADGVARQVALFGVGRVDAYGGLEVGSEAVDAVAYRFPFVALQLAGESGTQRPFTPERTNNPPDRSMGIAWVGRPGSYMTVSYVSVLNGEVPASFFSNRYVLIGATATGLGDRLATPTSSNHGSMAGIEIHANILDGVLNHREIRIASNWHQYAFTVLPLILAMLAYWMLASRYALAWTLGLLLAMGLVSVISLRWYGLWLSPSAAFLSVVTVYVIWSWRRLEAVLRYFSGEHRRLESENQVFPELVDQPESENKNRSLGWLLGGDTLEKQINALHRSIDRIRNLRQFLTDGLENMPVALFITDRHGRILMRNYESRLLVKSEMQAAGSAGVDSNNTIEQALKGLVPQISFGMDPYDAVFPPDYRVLDGRDLVTVHGLNLQLAVAPVTDAKYAVPMGWIFALVDLSAERQIQAHRADLLRFLSHDLRTPQVSILAILDLQQDPETALPPSELAQRLQRQVRHTLRLTDDFLQLAKAEAQSEYQFTLLDLSDLVLEAVDQVWPLARHKRIVLDAVLPPLGELTDEFGNTSSLVRADGDLLRRALVNLLHNAVRYSPSNTQVTVTVLGNGPEHPGLVRVMIEDQGIGIPAEDIPLIFQRYRRLSKRSVSPSIRVASLAEGVEPHLVEPVALPTLEVEEKDEGHEPIQGLGLGLTQVKAVIDSHQGSIRCTSTVGQGTCFVIELPWAPAF